MYWRSYYRQSTRSRYTSIGCRPQETIFRNTAYDMLADMGDYNDPLTRPRPPRRDNNPSLRSAARVRDRRQNNIVVQLYDLEAPGGRFGQAGEQFSVNQNVLFTSLPRTRNAVRRGTLQLGSFFIPQDMAAHPPHIIHQALYFLFRHLQDYSRTGVIDMFGAAELEIEDDPSRHFAVNRWAGMMHALCVILDNERGLGCSDMLLAEILDFFESLIRDVHNLVGWEETAILFEAFAGIFKTTRTSLMHQVRRIWNRFDPEVQDQLLGDMRRALPVEGVDGKAHRMYRALGY